MSPNASSQDVALERYAFRMRLYPGMAEEYRRRHDAIWPELVELLRKAGIGGVSEMVGWTEIQQAERKASRIGGKDAMLSSPLIQIAILALLVDLAIFVYEKVTGGYGG